MNINICRSSRTWNSLDQIIQELLNSYLSACHCIHVHVKPSHANILPLLTPNQIAGQADRTLKAVTTSIHNLT